jgi:hypothetical protein
MTSKTNEILLVEALGCMRREGVHADLDQFLRVVRSIDHFWPSVAKRPARGVDAEI